MDDFESVKKMIVENTYEMKEDKKLTKIRTFKKEP